MINHQQFCVIIGNVHAAECVGWRDVGRGAAEGKKSITLYYCGRALLTSVGVHTFHTWFVSTGGRLEQCGQFGRWGKTGQHFPAWSSCLWIGVAVRRKKKNARYLDALAAYITGKYPCSLGMELRPQSGHRRVLADWIDLMHTVIRSVCSHVGADALSEISPSLQQAAVKKSRDSHFPNTKLWQLHSSEMHCI